MTVERPTAPLASRYRAVRDWASESQVVSRCIAVARIVYLPLALALVAWYAYRAAGRVDLDSVEIGPLVWSVVAALAWWLLLASGWSLLISRRVGRDGVTAWCRTQAMRYLPGGFWAPVARAGTVKGRLGDKVTAVAVENVAVLAVSLAAGGLWLAGRWPLAALLALIALIPVIGARPLAAATKVSQAGLLRASGSYAAGFAAYGVVGLLSQLAVSGTGSVSALLSVAGVSCIAWAAGLVVVFAPGGVGVREVVYVWLLDREHLYPHAQLQAAAVTSRLVTVLAEMLVLLAVSLPARRAGRSAVS